MYASARRAGLGELTPVDEYGNPIMDDSGVAIMDPMPMYLPDLTMTPTVINTTVQPTTPTTPFAPVSIDPTRFPQQLPPIIATAAPVASASSMPIAALLVLLGIGWYAATRGRRGR